MSDPQDNQRLRVIMGDLTAQPVDAVVNAANTTLLGGGGVDGAIHRAAGPELLIACQRLDGCPTGQSRITEAFNLPSRYVIHTVGPVWSGGNRGEPMLLASCYETALQLAADHQLNTVAFPAISCGAYRFPLRQAATIAVETTCSFLHRCDYPKEVTFICFDSSTYEVQSSVLTQLRSETK